MEELPIELKAMVANSVEDPQTLMSLALTNKAFYATIKRDEARLCRNICYQRIGRELMPLAFAVHDCTFLRSPRAYHGEPQSLPVVTVESVAQFVDHYFAPQGCERRSIDLECCRDLFAFHGIVEHYASVTAELALKNTPGGSTGSASPSEAEIGRFKKSLYLTELLSIIFPRDYLSSPTAVTPGEAALRPAWQYLLTKFAPWELQQVRCIKELLPLHLRDVLSSVAAQAKQTGLISNARLLRAFASNERLTGLSVLESLRDQSGALKALARFSSQAQNWISKDPWFGVHDTMWLEQIGPFTSFAAAQILDQYPEADSGPRDAWLHTLLQPHADEDIFGEGARHCFACDWHATHWGFAFWDRERLNSIARGSLPATAEMLFVGENTILHTDDLLFYARFRKERYCTCPRR